MKSLALFGWIVAFSWACSAQTAELNGEALATFLPSAQIGYTKDSEVMESERPAVGSWASARYSGTSTFILTIQKGTPTADNLQAMVERFSQSERPVNIVDINGVGFYIIGGECFTALPGDVFISCSRFDPDVRAHLEIIDYEGLSTLATDPIK